MNEYAKAIMAYKYACKISKKIKGAIPDHYDVLALYGIGNAYEMVGSIDRPVNTIPESKRRITGVHMKVLRQE